jgi:hypothetical protein
MISVKSHLIECWVQLCRRLKSNPSKDCSLENSSCGNILNFFIGVDRVTCILDSGVIEVYKLVPCQHFLFYFHFYNENAILYLLWQLIYFPSHPGTSPPTQPSKCYQQAAAPPPRQSRRGMRLLLKLCTPRTVVLLQPLLEGGSIPPLLPHLIPVPVPDLEWLTI